MAKEGGVKWKTMTVEIMFLCLYFECFHELSSFVNVIIMYDKNMIKKPYIDRAVELKAKYEKDVAFNDAKSEQV